MFAIYLCLVLFIVPTLSFNHARFGARCSLKLSESAGEEELREAADFEVSVYLNNIKCL